MSAPVGLYYALRYYSNGLYGGVNNQELGFKAVDSTYTGSLSTSASEILGSAATGDVGLGIGTGNEIKEIDVKLEKKQIEAVTRKLRTRFSEELFQDMFFMNNINLRDQLYTALAKEIATEIDLEIIEKINTVYVEKKVQEKPKIEYITKEVEKLVMLPSYSNVCFDATGLQYTNSIITRTYGNGTTTPSKPSQ
jgi:hypothetical protein